MRSVVGSNRSIFRISDNGDFIRGNFFLINKIICRAKRSIDRQMPVRRIFFRRYRNIIRMALNPDVVRNSSENFCQSAKNLSGCFIYFRSAGREKNVVQYVKRYTSFIFFQLNRIGIMVFDNQLAELFAQSFFRFSHYFGIGHFRNNRFSAEVASHGGNNIFIFGTVNIRDSIKNNKQTEKQRDQIRISDQVPVFVAAF